jgi:CheY-like chemotaxis protein
MNDRVGTKVLIVEDTMVQALRLQHLLESNSFAVNVVYSGKEALLYLESARPDLILSDATMPEIDGYELCKRIKSAPVTANIPFILMSSFQDAQDIARIIDCGADNFLLKRFDQAYLISRLNEIIDSQSHRESNPSSGREVFVLAGKELSSRAKSSVQLTDMVVSAFATIMYLVPLVEDD